MGFQAMRGAEFRFSREDDVSEAFYFTDGNEIVLTCKCGIWNGVSDLRING